MKKPNAEQIEADQDAMDRERAKIIASFPPEIRAKALLVEEAREKLKKANIDFLMLTPGFRKDKDTLGVISFYGIEDGWSNEKGLYNDGGRERFQNLVIHCFDKVCLLLAHYYGRGEEGFGKEKLDYLQHTFNIFMAFHRNILKKENDE